MYRIVEPDNIFWTQSHSQSTTAIIAYSSASDDSCGGLGMRLPWPSIEITNLPGSLSALTNLFSVNCGIGSPSLVMRSLLTSSHLAWMSNLARGSRGVRWRLTMTRRWSFSPTVCKHESDMQQFKNQSKLW